MYKPREISSLSCPTCMSFFYEYYSLYWFRMTVVFQINNQTVCNQIVYDCCFSFACRHTNSQCYLNVLCMKITYWPITVLEIYFSEYTKRFNLENIYIGSIVVISSYVCSEIVAERTQKNIQRWIWLKISQFINQVEQLKRPNI